MPVESASYISDLNASYPASTDGVKEGDDHVRLIKQVVKNTFPNITGPITATQGALNNPILTSTPGADQVPYFTSTSGAAVAAFPAYGRSLVAATTAAAARSVLSVPESSTVVLKAGDTMTGGLTVPAFTVSSTAPRIFLSDTDWGSRSLYADGGSIGFLSSTGSWSWYVDNNGNSVATGNVTAYSDERLKTNVATIENALEIVSGMRGVRFERIDMPGQVEVGVIAQETEKVLPEVVAIQGEFKAVAYGNIVGVLIEAIKELKAEVETLKGR